MFKPLHETDYDQYVEIEFRDPVLWVKMTAHFNQFQLCRIQELINSVGVNNILTEEAIYTGISGRRRVEVIRACLDILVVQGWIGV